MKSVGRIFSKRSWSLVDDLKELNLGDSDAFIGEWKGIKALRLNKAGAAAFINSDFHLESFRIQAFVAIPESVGFIGLAFGARDLANYELIYLSPGDAKANGEIQYDPVMNGSTTWQIYNGPNYLSSTPYNVGDWVKFTIDVDRHSANVYIGDDTCVPQLVISKLQHGKVFGKIGVWGYLPVYIRDISIEEIPNNPSILLNERSKDQFVNEWLVSQPYFSKSLPDHLLEWTKASTEENGTLNINRLYTSEKDKSVQIKSTFTLSGEALTKVSFGFSDEVRIWINEVEIYQGSCMWAPPELDGRIRPDHVCIPITWRTGENTIRAEITSKETVFGWGFCLKTGIQSLN